MPQFFENAVMTNAGAALLARSIAEGVAIDFLSVAVGNGSYTNAEKAVSALRQRTALKSFQVEYEPSSIMREDDNAVRISALITNFDPSTQEAIITSGFYINEIGIMAQPHDEATDPILFSISVTAGTQGDYMPAYTGDNPAQIVQGYVTAVNSEATITVTAPVDVYALAEDLEALSQSVDTRIASIPKHNANLLDNPFFGVKKDNGNLLRWGTTGTRVYNVDGTITLSSNSIIQLWQSIDPKVLARLENRTLTLSAIINNQLHKFTYVQDGSDHSESEYTDGVRLKFRYVNQTRPEVIIESATGESTTATFKAVKLELGSESTLIYDVAPNDTLEEAKGLCSEAFEGLTNIPKKIVYDDSTAGLSNLMGGLGNAIGMRGWNQQILPTLIPTATNNGITYTNNGNGTITANGTATAYSRTSESINLTVGHKYFMSGTPKNGYVGEIGITVSSPSAYDTGNGVLFTADTSNVTLYVYAQSGAILNNIVFTPMLIDITTLFGAGNEPTTVADFKKMFPADYYPYCPILNVNVLLANLLPPNYNPSSTYTSGAICTHGNAMYQNISGSIVSGAWNASYWTKVTLGNMAVLGYTETATW